MLDPEVEIQASRGIVIGHDEVRRWATRKVRGHLHQRLVLEAVREQGKHVIAFVRREWFWREGGDVADAQDLTIVATIGDDGLITRWQPFDDREEALQAAGVGRRVVSDALAAGPTDGCAAAGESRRPSTSTTTTVSGAARCVDDQGLYERLCLEAFQSGLSWLTILRKREAFRAAFAEFEIDRVAAFGSGDVKRLLADEGIVRNRAKIEAAIANARAVAKLRDARRVAGGELIWSFRADTRERAPRSYDDVPSTTPESKALARELKRRGFRFVGPTTAYALMQACGLVNDHLAGCAVRQEVEDERRRAIERALSLGHGRGRLPRERVRAARGGPRGPDAARGLPLTPPSSRPR